MFIANAKHQNHIRDNLNTQKQIIETRINNQKFKNGLDPTSTNMR